MGEIIVENTDITKKQVDAIVNQANSSGTMGGGVAYHIKRAGGVILEEEARRQAPIKVGTAILTKGGSLPCAYVIHAPTMKRPAEKTNSINVKLATKAALDLALEKHFKTLAFPGMGTGVGGLNFQEAAKTMISEIKKSLDSFDTIYLVDVNQDMTEAFKKGLG